MKVGDSMWVFVFESEGICFAQIQWAYPFQWDNSARKINQAFKNTKCCLISEKEKYMFYSLFLLSTTDNVRWKSILYMPLQERVRREEQRWLRKVKWHLIVLASTYSIDVKLFHSVQMQAVITSHSYPALNGVNWRSGFGLGLTLPIFTGTITCMWACGHTGSLWLHVWLSVDFLDKKFFRQSGKVGLTVSHFSTGKLA